MKITRNQLRRLINEAMMSGSSNSINLKNLDQTLAVAIINSAIKDISFDLRKYTHEYRESVRNHLEQLIELCESRDSDIIGKLYMKKQEADANGDFYINDTIERIFDDCTEVGNS